MQQKEREKQYIKSQPERNAIKREIHGISVEQRIADGFINGTAMCVAYRKGIDNWLKTNETWELATALAKDLEVEIKSLKRGISVYTRVSVAYPTLVTVKEGSPENGGGTWLHPDLAIQLAQWCNPVFAIQVSRWVREWIVILEQNRHTEEEKRNQWKAVKACVLPTAKRFV